MTAPTQRFHHRTTETGCDCPIHRGRAREPLTAPLGYPFAGDVHVEPITRERAGEIYAAHHSYMTAVPEINLVHHGLFYQSALVGAITYRYPLLHKKAIRYDATGQVLPDTEPVERVWSVIKRVDDAATVDDVACRARVAESVTQEFLETMASISVIESNSEGYRVPRKVRIALEACRMLDRVDSDLDDRIEELRMEEDPDDTTRRNRAIAKVAVALRDAVSVESEM